MPMSLSYVCSDPLKTRLYFYQSQNAFSCLNMDLTWVLKTHKKEKKIQPDSKFFILSV